VVFVDIGAPPAVASTVDDEMVIRYPDTPAIGAPPDVATSTTASATAAAPASSTTPAVEAQP